MADILNANIVLRLNAINQRIGWATVREAFSAMMGGENGSEAYLGLDISYELDNKGLPIYDKMIDLSRITWDDWLLLPIRPWDMSINCVRQKIRVPTVVVCPNFNSMPKKEQRHTPTNIRKRDNNKCQYTNVPLTNTTFTLDHILPKSLGGKDSWENLVACHKDVNSKKGNRLNSEAGLKLLKKPTAPRSIPLCAVYTEVKHPDHSHF
jgi:5-methylcytosine-specific restriction endonuclease McrA